ncbi:MAG: glucose-1-phosphate adenylyltransferase [Armatimonadota bacterium]
MSPVDPVGNALAMVLAGGQGERLYPLTRDRAKPAVFFGGIYRIIDFTLSNCANSGLRRIYLLTQYRSLSLDRHIRLGWSLFNAELDEFVYTVPPQQRMRTDFYQGTADAIYQNIYTLQMEKPGYVVILSGDHVYKMNYGRLLAFHVEKQADLTVACVAVPRDQATSLGVAGVDEDSRMVAFDEKPDDPKTIPDEPEMALCSMGVYVFTTEVLVRAVIEDARRDTQHDFGRNIVPALVGARRVFAYDFRDERTGEPVYWRDIGSLDSYYEANMDLVAVEPKFNLYDEEWPVRTQMTQCPPAKTVLFTSNPNAAVIDSLVSGGCIVSGARISRSILSPGVRVERDAEVTDSIIFPGACVGEGARLRRAIVDRGVHIPAGACFGCDAEEDRRRATVTPGGVAVITRVAALMENEGDQT